MPPPVQPVVRMNEQGVPAWLDEVAQRCARISSCAHSHDTPRLRDPSACVDWWIDRVRSVNEPVHKCLALAKTCDEIGACVREKGDPRAAEYCRTHPGVLGACDGERLVSCGDDSHAESTGTDCSLIGAHCAEQRVAGGLVVRACFSTKLCPPEAPEARCDGQANIFSCHDGAAFRASCNPGSRCEEHKDNDGEITATCEPLEGHPHCEEVGARYCDHDRLVDCVDHGHFGDVRVSDCAALGLRCRGKGEKAACTIDPRPECEPMPPRCDGEALAFCAAGHVARVSCSALGMGSCDPDARGPEAGCRSQAAKTVGAPSADAGAPAP